MTQEQQHTITPPLELVEQWRMIAPRARDCGASAERWIVWTAAAWFRNQYQPKIQAAADQELEALLAWLRVKGFNNLASDLLAARRRKPPSLKEQALELLKTYNTSGVMLTADQADTIRRALEALND